MNGFRINEDEITVLEALIQSPAFTTLKKVLGRYRDECQSVLLTTPEANKMFETRGRIIGINTVENLPGILVSQRLEKNKREKERNDLEEKNKRRVSYPAQPERKVQ